MFQFETFFIGALIDSFAREPEIFLFSDNYRDVIKNVRENRGYHFQVNTKNAGMFNYYAVSLKGQLFNEKVNMTMFSSAKKTSPTSIAIVGSAMMSDVQIVGHQRDLIPTEEAMFLFSMALGASTYWDGLRQRIAEFHRSIFNQQRRGKNSLVSRRVKQVTTFGQTEFS